jgi:hypothetical protein
MRVCYEISNLSSIYSSITDPHFDIFPSSRDTDISYDGLKKRKRTSNLLNKYTQLVSWQSTRISGKDNYDTVNELYSVEVTGCLSATESITVG